MARDSAEVVRRFWIEVWGDGRFDHLAEIVTDPYLRHSKQGTRVRSLDELRADIVQYRRVLGDLQVEFHDQSVAGDRVWSRLTTSGLDQDTGELHVLSWLQLHRVVDGRIAESWELYEAGLDWTD